MIILNKNQHSTKTPDKKTGILIAILHFFEFYKRYTLIKVDIKKIATNVLFSCDWVIMRHFVKN